MMFSHDALKRGVTRTRFARMNNEGHASRPGQSDLPHLLDQRLAHLLVRRLRHLPIHPNALTTLTLLLGLGCAASFLVPGFHALGALCFMLAVFSDHLDGELARQTGKTSRFGHLYDFVVGGLNYTLLFACMGIGLTAQEGTWTAVLGVTAALCNPVIMTLRVRMDNAFGLEATEHPSFGWFNLEDFIYTIGPITWVWGAVFFFVPFALGTIAYLIWTIFEYRRWFGRQATG